MGLRVFIRADRTGEKRRSRLAFTFLNGFICEGPRQEKI
jgi:hypothetical protein